MLAGRDIPRTTNRALQILRRIRPKIGMTSAGRTSLILTGQMTREEAWNGSRPAYDEQTISQDFEYVAKLDLT
jgi:hypothetical protein